MKISFTPVGKKANGKDEWGVRVTAEKPGGGIVFAGKDVEVRKRDGQMRDVTLGALIDSKDGGKVGIYNLTGEAEGLTAATAIVKIAMVLQAKSWSRSTLDEVADLIIEAGYPVTKPPVKKPAAPVKKAARSRKAAA